MQSVKRFACGISFARYAWKLAPASVGVPFRFQRPDERPPFRGTRARIGRGWAKRCRTHTFTSSPAGTAMFLTHAAESGG